MSQSATDAAAPRESRAPQLVAIAITLLVVALGIIGSASESSRAPAGPATPPPPPTPMLELQAASATRGYGYITIEGLVKNVSGNRQEDVVAVAVVTDANGQFITSGDALIDYNPILAGQASPFSVMVRDNPAIEKWEVSFKEFFGGEIPMRDARKP